MDLTRETLEAAIAECRGGKSAFPNYQKLDVFLSLKKHLFPDDGGSILFQTPPPVPDNGGTGKGGLIRTDGGSDFLEAIDGLFPDELWPILDELMDAVSVTNPPLYAAVLRKIEEI